MAKIACPKCHRTYSIDDNLVGRKVTCSANSCGTKFTAAAPLDVPALPATSWQPLPPKTFSEPPQDLTAALETRRHRKRMLLLGMLAAVPGVVVLIGLLIWGMSALGEASKKQAAIAAYKKQALAYLDTARQLVNAWPNDVATVTRISSHMADDFQSLKNLPDDPKLAEVLDRLSSISICLLSPVMFIENEPRAKEFLRERADGDSAWLQREIEQFAQERRDADRDIKNAGEMIDQLASELAK